MKIVEIVTDWINAWNNHEIERIMNHYDNDIEFTVQTAVTRWGKADGKLKGKEELRKHFSRGLALAPNIHFIVEEIFYAPSGYAVLYRRENGNRVLDTVELNKGGLATKVTAYYVHEQL